MRRLYRPACYFWSYPSVGGQQFPGSLRDFEAVQELGLHDPDKRTHQEPSDTLRFMLWGIDRDAWVSVWAGALGAIPAAVISAAVAAWVAVAVLNRSNRHQQKLAAEAIAQQKELGFRQLEEQRAEAARSREHAAVADVLTSVESLLIVNRSSLEDVTAQVSVFLAAIARWRVEMGKSPMERELREWSVVLIGAVGEKVAAEELGDSEAEDGDERVTDVAAEIINVALQWPSASAETRLLMQTHLTEARAGLERPSGAVPGGDPVP